MTLLSTLVSDPEAFVAPLRVRAPELITLPRAVAGIGGEERHRDVERTGPLQLRVADMTRAGLAATLSRRDLRESARTWLHSPHPPGREPVIGESLLAEIGRLERRSALFALLDAYLDGFNADDADVLRLAGQLSGMNADWPWRATDPWPARLEAFDLLTPANAPARIASAVLASEKGARSVFEEAGLNTEGRKLGGLGEAAFRSACLQVGAMKAETAIPPQERLMSWAGEAGGLVYPKAWPEFAGALFRPWRSADPARKHKTVIIERALAYAGDPRINQARWRPVKDAAGDAYEVILRWLTRASVEQFFDIVSETMTDRPDMWAERRKFWTDYLRADMISAAWVAFGSDGARRADRAATLTRGSGLSMFGRLSAGSGRSSQHAALIMRIGDLTIVDWSHSGSWNIWTRGAPHHPELFRHNTRRFSDYAPAELMNAPTKGPHMSGWQYKVANIIKAHTGLRP